LRVQSLLRLTQCIRAPGDQSNMRADSGETMRDVEPDATTSPGDDRHLPAQIHLPYLRP
jgi:hypothetical protein